MSEQMKFKLMGLGSGENKVVDNYQDFVKSASANNGNLIFNFALQNIVKLSGVKIRWHTKSEVLNQDGSGLLLPMANNIGPHMDLLKSGPKLEGVNVPVVIMGIGVQFNLDDDVTTGASRVPEGSISWLKHLGDMSEMANISVRGSMTKSFFEHIGLGHKVVALGCPSHFISRNKTLGEALGKKSRAITKASLANGIGITAGSPHKPQLAILERFLIKILTEYGGSYLVQDPSDLIKLAEGWAKAEDKDSIETIRERWFPESTLEQMQTWFRRFSRTYVSVPQWFSDVSKHEMVVGTRIHGCQVALQSGVPTVCLYVDSRTKELCETMQVPCLEARKFQKDPNIDQLIETVANWDWRRYDENRIGLAKKTVDFANDNGLPLTHHLQELVS